MTHTFPSLDLELFPSFLISSCSTFVSGVLIYSGSELLPHAAHSSNIKQLGHLSATVLICSLLSSSQTSKKVYGPLHLLLY